MSGEDTVGPMASQETGDAKPAKAERERIIKWLRDGLDLDVNLHRVIIAIDEAVKYVETHSGQRKVNSCALWRLTPEILREKNEDILKNYLEPAFNTSQLKTDALEHANKKKGVKMVSMRPTFSRDGDLVYLTVTFAKL